MCAQVRHSWKDVRDQIHRRVLDGTYRPGDKLPRDEDIAEALGCARSTVQRAMQDLSDAGIVERKRKGGTHVRADPVSRATLDIPITRREVEAHGAVYGYRLVACGLAQTPMQIVTTLALPAPEQMLHVQALHLSDARPYIYEDRWISTRTAPEILNVDLARHSANEWLVRNKPYSRYDLRLYAISADEGAADQLDVDPGAALLVIERTTWIGDLPITTVRSVTTPGYQLLAQSGA
ncbi:GntR family transcriptional regulator [Rhodobacteraceae bacterium KMM 6894]|nr:GntR family transcriptional regulator [Rhodobacteraceae bacterium KMM 6894]